MLNFFTKTMPQQPTGKIPNHIAIVMDGNGRWAKNKRKPRVFGHKAGMDALKK